MARICSSAVPTHKCCAVGGKINGWRRPGRLWWLCSEASEDENTSTRFIARLATKKRLPPASKRHAAMRLACGAIKQKHGIIADINAARKVLRGTRLDADRKIGGMRRDPLVPCAVTENVPWRALNAAPNTPRYV